MTSNIFKLIENHTYPCISEPPPCKPNAPPQKKIKLHLASLLESLFGLNIFVSCIFKYFRFILHVIFFNLPVYKNKKKSLFDAK